MNNSRKIIEGRCQQTFFEKVQINITGPYGLCYNYSTLSLWHKDSPKQYIDKDGRETICSKETLFPIMGTKLDLTCRSAIIKTKGWLILMKDNFYKLSKDIKLKHIFHRNPLELNMCTV